MSNGLYPGQAQHSFGPVLEVKKLEFSLKLKISSRIGCLRTRVRKQLIIALYFELETVHKSGLVLVHNVCKDHQQMTISVYKFILSTRNMS